TFGTEDKVSILIVHLYDNHSSVAADLSYSVFPKHNIIMRSVNITNHSKGNITVESLVNMSVDFPYEDMDMISLRGDWARETQPLGALLAMLLTFIIHSLLLWTPPVQNPLGFSLVYSGSFAIDVEKGSQGFTRALIGVNPSQPSWLLGPSESLISTECVAVYSDNGVGRMSRSLHNLYQKNVIKNKFATKDRPAFLNSWEGLGDTFNESTIYRLAKDSAALGIKLFVLDDGWFGDKYPRTSDEAGLGDWVPNPKRFPDGLTPTVDKITTLKAANTSTNLCFGLWFELEMVNPKSTLVALHAGPYPRKEAHNQFFLNIALPKVQDFIINSVSNILNSSDISYVK
ncbi:hypothetical protein N7495_001950, partial [Penicillium taxi]|uniref:uncharacterized protein n=1 Tax=Penicillium taxi TaxID=168475 RepID=UPI0025450E81